MDNCFCFLGPHQHGIAKKLGFFGGKVKEIDKCNSLLVGTTVQNTAARSVN